MPAVITTEDIDFLQASYEHVFAARTKHALIVDTTTIEKIPDATLRRRMKEFEDGRRPIIREKNIGSAIVLSNSRRIDPTKGTGAVRVSLGMVSTLEDVEAFEKNPPPVFLLMRTWRPESSSAPSW